MYIFKLCLIRHICVVNTCMLAMQSTVHMELHTVASYIYLYIYIRNPHNYGTHSSDHELIQ